MADHVYDALLRWRALAWPDVAGGGRTRLLSLAAEAEALAGWTGERHAPAPPGEAEMAALQAELDAAPEGVRRDLSDWLLPEWRASLGDAAASVAVSLARRAPLDLRTTMTRATPEAAIARRAEDGVAAEPGPLSPACLRVTDGARALLRAGAFLDGWVEIQDAASQAAAGFAAAAPGERVLDYCAGGGGKALARADAGASVDAHDLDPRRMADLPKRAARVGAKVRLVSGMPDENAYDLVFVDAPCSGSGAWRGNPDGKWALSEPGLQRLRTAQQEALLGAARALRPGGRMSYATCSLLQCENGAQARAFAAPAGFELEEERNLTPLDGGDGFYMSRLRCNSR